MAVLYDEGMYTVHCQDRTVKEEQRKHQQMTKPRVAERRKQKTKKYSCCLAN
jgi:hypothetical protein